MLLRAVSAALFACAFPCFSQTAPAPVPAFADAVKQAAVPVVVRDGALSGEGAAALLHDIAASRFVLIGESHLSREIPAFTTAVCNAMHPDAYAVEVGPQAAQFVQTQLRDPQRAAHTAARMKQFPSNMAFLDSQQESDTAAACAASSHNAAFAVWGLDQEFLGAAGALLDSMSNTHPGPRASAAIQAAQAKERAAEALAAKDGDVGKLYLIAMSDDDVKALTEAVAADGTPATNRILHELTESRRIYRMGMRGEPDSNRVRNILMKQHFLADYLPVGSEKPDARVLFKFGAMHAGKGFSQLHQREIGNTVAELADVQGAQSLHIFIMGARGVLPGYGGYRRPWNTAPFDEATDKDNAWLLPALAAMAPSTAGTTGMPMTVVDLRKLRFRRKLDMPDEWKRLIYSYDLFVLIPEVTPATMAQ